ncbi:hypothetical protein Tco_1480487 [Tanacetum coccineum]
MAKEAKIIQHEDLTARVEEFKVKLKEAQSLVEKDPYNKEVKVKAVESLFEYNEAIKDEENLLAQKVRVEWLDAGDKNNLFFHNLIKGRRSKNRVEIICDENGNSYEKEEVPLQFVNHFQQFLGNLSSVVDLVLSDDLFSTVLTNADAEEMIKEVSEKEIKEAMFDIGDNKAPGPDGFSYVFFKKHGMWEKRAKTRGPYFTIFVYTCNGNVDFIAQRKIRNSDGFRYHHGCKELKVVKLCFAVDLMIFCHGDIKSVGVISDAIKEFSAMSGLFPNMNKSTLFFGSLNSIEKD